MLIGTLRRHWPEYLMEAALLGAFMVVAAAVTALVEHPAILRDALPSALVRRLLTGLAMGLTAIALIYSPWGKQSGAHLNPSVTLAFYRLGRIEPVDLLFYLCAQFAGASAGIGVAATLLPVLVAAPEVNYVATLPGEAGPWAAFAGEAAISFVLMTVVLAASNTPHLARFTGVFAGCLVATYITIEAPLSGMSMNPARSFGPTLFTGAWAVLWIYVTAPLAGMLAAAHGFQWIRRGRPAICAKLHHQNGRRCIFRCGYAAQAAAASRSERTRWQSTAATT
jgi:aquaporin Z